MHPVTEGKCVMPQLLCNKLNIFDSEKKCIIKKHAKFKLSSLHLFTFKKLKD